MKQLVWLACWAIGMLFGGCQSKEAVFTSMTVEEFATLITQPDVQRLDVRTVAEYTDGHIPGSLNVNVLDEDTFLEMAEAALEKDRPVALYCRSGKRSKKAAEKLGRQGFQVYELDGGIHAWKAAGKPIQRK